MNLLPKTSANFSQKEYWESFFKKRGAKAFEWYGEYQELAEYIHGYIKQTEEILMVGCGNSSLSMDMYDADFTKITNIDISTTVIKHMVKLNKNKRPLMKFLHMNALDMSFKDNEFFVAIDKGTLDALMTDDSPESLERGESLFNEITRVTSQNGRYICISLLQEHILRKLLTYFTNIKWKIRIERCLAAEQKAIDRGEIGMPVFVIICSNVKKKDAILEFVTDGGETVTKVKSIEEMVSAITSMQQAVQIVSGLNRSSLSDEEEVFFELYKPGDNSNPRYSIYVLDKAKTTKFNSFAAFIVPQGREPEWLFSTKAGRRKLLSSANYKRMAIVTMHREQNYGSLEDVKKELNDHIGNFAPVNMKTRIDYLSLGNDVGERDVKFKGNSEISGPFIIEDVTSDNDTYRRLIFLNSQNIIQSEAKLKEVKSGRRRKTKIVADPSYIACEHHIYMGLGAHAACTEANGNIAVIGLGGGGLCMFLRQYLPQAKITAVDIDPAMLDVATKWFGLEQTEQMEIKIEDGLKFLENELKTENKYNAVLFDVDSKDTSLGMSCPPKEFLETTVLENITKLLENNGLFILNLVLRDESLRPNVYKTLQSKFKHILSYKIEEDLNEIFFCNVVKEEENEFKEKLTSALSSFNSLCQKKKIQNDELDIKEIMESLKIK